MRRVLDVSYGHHCIIKSFVWCSSKVGDVLGLPGLLSHSSLFMFFVFSLCLLVCLCV
jgi:hypothetical protein